jgi:fatty-acyl-CoA synthase
MNQRHLAFWPRRRPLSFPIPVTNVAENLATSAKRYPAHPAIVYYDTTIPYARLWREVEAMAGYLQTAAGVEAGDRVMLFMQNSPQFVISYYAILRANAVVVPLNPMLVAKELAVYVEDSGARVAIVGAELLDRLGPYAPAPLRTVIVATYSDYVEGETHLTLPAAVAAPARPAGGPPYVAWKAALAADHVPGPITACDEDIALLPYTSGTTGRPKGCVHTHRTLQTTTTAVIAWGGVGSSGGRVMSVLPYFHVTGMTVDMNATLYTGSTLVMTTRWDASTAIALIERYGCDTMTAISTMVVDMLAQPDFRAERISTLRHLGGGGAPLPAAVGEQLIGRLGLTYMEGYGLTETISMTHSNPAERPKLQCLGIPTFGIDSRVIDPDSCRELGPNEAGEIVISGAQVMREYWHQPEATAEAFLEIDGKRFLRTGDLGYFDDDGYYFMVDRLKRMINASGLKVWPAEVESKLFAHPAIKEACVIGATDPRKGEVVKALVVLREGAVATPEEIVTWSRDQMSAYKVPTIVEFVDSLPRSGTGKVQWRELQEREAAGHAAAVR